MLDFGGYICRAHYRIKQYHSVVFCTQDEYVYAHIDARASYMHLLGVNTGN